MYIKKLFSIAVMAGRTHDYFGLANMLGNYLLKIVQLTAMMLIWKALFASGVDTEGMTLRQVLQYTYMGAVLAPMLNVATPASDWLHEGDILSNFMRPVGIFAQLVAHTFGTWAQPMLLFALPALCLAPALGINIVPASPWVALSIPLCVSQGFAMDFLFACLLIRLKNMSWTVQSIRWALSALLTGAVIPFSLLPWNMGAYLQYTPFGTLAGAALGVYTGVADVQMVLIAQICWNVLLWPLAFACFARSRERMMSYGG